MNKEYRKFNASTQEYLPRATDPDHFRHLPDVLIPEDYHEPAGDPLEKDLADLIRESKTPPPTPPELEPGRAGCLVFREVLHYTDPIYQDPDVQRRFTTQLILANVCTYLPTVIVLTCLIADISGDLDFIVLNNPKTLMILFGLSLMSTGFYIYFVGLFRNRPLIYIAVFARVVLTTLLLVSSMLLIHLSFLTIIEHPVDEDAEHNVTRLGVLVSETGLKPRLDHAPPYMAILVVFLMGIVTVTISVLLMKYKYNVDDYRIPFVIYTACFSISAILVTIVLNNGFGKAPAYDLFQVIVGCYFTSMLLMRTPNFIDRLYEGKVCPLKKGELLYALIHYGL